MGLENKFEGDFFYFGVLVCADRPHKPYYAYDIARLHSVMNYTDLMENFNVYVTKIVLLHCLTFFSKPKAEKSIPSGKLLKNRDFENLSYGSLLNFFNSSYDDSKDTRRKKLPVIFVGTSYPVLTFSKAADNYF